MNIAAALQQIADAFAAISTFSWIIVLAGILVPIPMAYFPQIKQGFHQWRLDRRLARDPIIYQDELNSYEYQIGEELDEVDWREILWDGTLNGCLVACMFAASELEENWTGYALLVVLGGPVLYAIWHSWRTATYDREWYQLPPMDIPGEAVWGAIGAFVIVSAIITFAVYFF